MFNNVYKFIKQNDIIIGVIL